MKPREFKAAEVELMEDLAQMVMGALELRLAASKDSLTGALSRRAFKEELARTVALALRHHHHLSVIGFDLDHFKTVNDTYGHAAGDLVLSRTVQACNGVLRNTDLIGRLGGEEFAVLLPNTAQANAIPVAEKMRIAVERQRIIFDNQIIKLTASFGIASLDYAIRDLDALLELADHALYSAKSAGRNRCATLNKAPRVATQPRRRVLKAGQIIFNDRRSTVNCTVRFLSNEGAGLDLSNSAGVPSRFDLLIKADDFERPCRVVSQTEKHLDVNFC
jgi:diguanylate cyclase (GGDEF)-like protein